MAELFLDRCVDRKSFSALRLVQHLRSDVAPATYKWLVRCAKGSMFMANSSFGIRVRLNVDVSIMVMV